MGEKRRRTPTQNAALSRKKQKARAENSATEINEPSQGSKEIVQMDELDWRRVDLPDILEGVEGFYGLDEIDGVEIIASSGGKNELKFKVLKDDICKNGESNKSPVHDEEIWEGFSDADIENQHGEPAPAKEKNKTKKIDVATSKAAKLPVVKGKGGNRLDLPFNVLERKTDEGVDVSEWDCLNLHPELLLSLSKLKLKKPTPIQLSSIPEILSGKDVIGKAVTGSGKTLAFGLPILQRHLDKYGYSTDCDGEHSEKEDGPLALILSPTRELAHQLVRHLKEVIDSASQLDARVASVTGGFSVQKQYRMLENAHIIVGTPGRLWDVISSTPNFLERLKSIEFLVIDEADRLLGDGHFEELGKVLTALDRVQINDDAFDESEVNNHTASNFSSTGRQTLVFSATFQKSLQSKLAKSDYSYRSTSLDSKQSMEYLLQKLKFKDDKPTFIDVNPISQMAKNLKEGIVECAAMEKDLYLYTTLLLHPKHRTLVFTNSISSVRRLTHYLQNLQLPASSLHSSMVQKARSRSVERFSSSESDPSSILVATDVAARGLDIQCIDLIIHYHVPRTADMYIHRSGRTARAQASGKSILICSPEETAGVTRLVSQVHVASNGPSRTPKNRGIPIQPIYLDRGIVSRLRPRSDLSKRVSECVLAKEKISSENDWLRSAADDLGVEYDPDEFEASQSKGRNRGGGRRTQELQAGQLSSAELANLKAQLRGLLSKPVNVGVSEKYITSGRVDIDSLLKGKGNAAFLGHIDELQF